MTDPNFGPLGYVPYGSERPYGKWQSGATAFGIVAILFGALSGCFALFVPLALILPQPPSVHAAPKPPIATLMVGLVLYVSVAVAFISWGVGAIRRRRWVRPLALIAASVTIFCGIIGIAAMSTVMLGALSQQISRNNPSGAPISEGMITTIFVVELAIAAVIFIAVPGSFLLFFRSSNVKAMLEICDPVERWTDRCPTPALAIPVLLAFYGVSMFGVVPMGVMPMFGVILRGPAAILAALILALISFWLMRQTYHLRSSGWTGTLLLALFDLVGYGLNAILVDQAKLFAAYSNGNTIDAARMANMVGHGQMLAVSLPAPLAAIVYLLCVRRYFTNNSDSDYNYPIPPMPPPQQF